MGNDEQRRQHNKHAAREAIAPLVLLDDRWLFDLFALFLVPELVEEQNAVSGSGKTMKPMSSAKVFVWTLCFSVRFSAAPTAKIPNHFKSAFGVHLVVRSLFENFSLKSV